MNTNTSIDANITNTYNIEGTIEAAKTLAGGIEPWVYPILKKAKWTSKPLDGRPCRDRKGPRFVVRVGEQRFTCTHLNKLESILKEVTQIGDGWEVFRNKSFGVTIRIYPIKHANHNHNPN
jgi:hypothetical protein